MYNHWPVIIEQFGLPRSLWAMPFEYNMSWFKGFLQNINFQASHLTITNSAMSYLSSDFITEFKTPGKVITPLFAMKEKKVQHMSDFQVWSLINQGFRPLSMVMWYTKMEI